MKRFFFFHQGDIKLMKCYPKIV